MDLEMVLAAVVRVMRRATSGHGETLFDQTVLDEFMAHHEHHAVPDHAEESPDESP